MDLSVKDRCHTLELLMTVTCHKALDFVFVPCHDFKRASRNGHREN